MEEYEQVPVVPVPQENKEKCCNGGLVCKEGGTM